MGRQAATQLFKRKDLDIDRHEVKKEAGEVDCARGHLSAPVNSHLITALVNVDVTKIWTKLSTQPLGINSWLGLASPVSLTPLLTCYYYFSQGTCNLSGV